MVLRRRPPKAGRGTVALGALAAVSVAAVAVGEIGRVWRRGSAPLPEEADDVFLAGQEAVAETVSVAVAGYHDVSSRENALFNMLASFVCTFVTVRLVTRTLRERPTFGPFRNLRVGHRHIHHFVPGIMLAFGSGGAAILTRNHDIEPKLAIVFGAGMGLTLDESALLLELEDVYWTERGVLSVQISSAVTAMLAAIALALRFLRRGEQLVLEDATAAPVVRVPPDGDGSPAT